MILFPSSRVIPWWFVNLSFLLMLLSSLDGLAQTVTGGYVKGSVVNDQQAAVINATILLRNATDSSVYKTGLSDEQGAFALSGIKDGSYILEISMMGFEKLTLAVAAINATNPGVSFGVLKISPASKNLGEVVVKGQTPFIERKFDMTVVNVENSIIGAGSTVLEMLDKLPGVVVNQNGQVSLNGKPNVNVFIDGKATTIAADDLSNLLRGMSSSTIQKIEIMTKPSAKYDASGSGGVINIVRKKNRKEGLNGSVNGSLGQGGYTRYNGGVTLNYKNKDYNLFFSGTYVHHQNFFEREVRSDIFSGGSQFLKQQQSQSYTVNTNNTFTPLLGADFYLSKRTTLSISGTGALQTSRSRIQANTDEFDDKLAKTGRLDFRSQTKSRPYNYNTTLHLAHQIDTSGRDISVDLDYANYYSDPEQQITNNSYDANDELNGSSFSLLDGNRRLNIYAGKADYSQALGSNGHLEAGWKSSYVKSTNHNPYYNRVSDKLVMDSSQSDFTENKENINALYLNANKEYNKWTVQLGVRAEHTWSNVEQFNTGLTVERNYIQLFPSVVLDYKINALHALNYKLSRRTDRPAYSDMIPFRRPLTATTFFKGNPNLRPQVAFGNELTYAYNNQFFATFTYEHTSNYISTMAFLDDNQETVTRVPSNISKSDVIELDLMYMQKLNSWWSTNNTVSIFNQSFNGVVNGFKVDVPGKPTFIFNTSNTLSLTGRLSAELALRYVYRRQLIVETYDAFYSVNAGFKYQVLAKRGTLALNAVNIFQTENRGSVDNYRNLNQYWYLYFDTRVVTLNFTYRFGQGKTSSLKARSASEDEKKRTRTSN